MDLNQLYFDHQLLLMRAARAPTNDVRRVHELAAVKVARHVRTMQRTLGASAAGTWDALAAANDCSATLCRSNLA